MIYFALNNDGLMCNLGDHGDHEAANAASFIQHEIENQDHCIYGD